MDRTTKSLPKSAPQYTMQLGGLNESFKKTSTQTVLEMRRSVTRPGSHGMSCDCEICVYWKYVRAEVENDVHQRWSMDVGGLCQRVKHTLTYELDELKRCLDRPEPNVLMALSRVRNIERMQEREGC